MFRKILVPTDGSEYSCKALEAAVELAGVMNGGIILLHVTPEEHHLQKTYRSEGTNDKVAISSELAFKATQGNLDLGDVDIRKKAITGYPAVGILEEAERNKVDLIVMGSHGHGPFRGAVLGSVANRVLSHAVCPVLIIR